MLIYETSDWLKNAAINGLLRILDQSEIPYEQKTHSVEIHDQDLKNFEENYFRYFINTYSNYTSWKQIIDKEYWLQHLDLNSMNDKDISALNDYIEMVKKRLTSNSYVNTYQLISELDMDLKQYGKQLSKIPLKKNQEIKDISHEITKVCNQLLEITAVLQQPEVKKYIVSRNIIYDVVAKYWNSVSFLHVKANKKSMYETYKEYFLNPLYKYIEEKKDTEKYSKYKYRCSICNNKISSISKAYDLTWLTKIGVDSARKSSHYWEYQNDTFICPECNFLYSCVPAGFIYFKRRGLFINENSSVQKLRNVNNVNLYTASTFEELEEQGYYQIIDSLNHAQNTQAEKEIDNIQIVKLDSDNLLRPYTFNTLSRERLQIIKENKNLLEKLIGNYVKSDEGYINLYQEVTQRIYQNRNQFDLIYKLTRLFISRGYNNLSTIWIILLISNQSQRRGGKMYYSQIKDFQKYGLQLREAYAGYENKLSGISYRLLNAAKIKNEGRFMDTLLNAYMYQKKPVPIDFIEALNNESKFQTIAYAFLLGLLGERGLNKGIEEGEQNAK